MIPEGKDGHAFSCGTEWGEFIEVIQKAIPAMPIMRGAESEFDFSDAYRRIEATIQALEDVRDALSSRELSICCRCDAMHRQDWGL